MNPFVFNPDTPAGAKRKSSFSRELSRSPGYSGFYIYRKAKDAMIHYLSEPVSKRCSLFKVKEGKNINHMNTLSISRIKI